MKPRHPPPPPFHSCCGQKRGRVGKLRHSSCRTAGGRAGAPGSGPCRGEGAAGTEQAAAADKPPHQWEPSPHCPRPTSLGTKPRTGLIGVTSISLASGIAARSTIICPFLPLCPGGGAAPRGARAAAPTPHLLAWFVPRFQPAPPLGFAGREPAAHLPGRQPGSWATARVTVVPTSRGVLAAHPQMWLVLLVPLCQGEMAVPTVFGGSVCPS